MAGIKEAIKASNAAKDAKTTGHSPELNAVLNTLKEYMVANNLSLVQAFHQFDEGNTGYLTLSDLMRMLRKLVPNLPSQAQR